MNKKIIYFSFIILILSKIPTFSYGQINGYIGSIGSFGARNIVFSGPIIIDDSSCFKITNGIKTIKKKYNLKGFNLNCEVLYPLKNNVLIFTSYPNPTGTYTFLKFIKSDDFLNVNQVVIIRLFDNSGNLYNIYKTSYSEIYNGYKIDLSNLSTGNYNLIIQVNSTNYQQSLKLFKY
jgi:hypothetical protein